MQPMFLHYEVGMCNSTCFVHLQITVETSSLTSGNGCAYDLLCVLDIHVSEEVHKLPGTAGEVVMCG